MANATLEPVVDSIHRLARKWTNREATDADLLNRFVARQDEQAFVALLERYARLVWEVCRRVHGHVHDAEDSFQATFFVFARQAGKIRRSGSLASWLYRLAYRTAMHAKKSAYRRRLREKKVAVAAGQSVAGSSGLQELQAVLDSEVNRLAEKYRAPFVLCCLEGRSKSEAAAELGWKPGTVSSRLAQARKLLQERLTRRGITLAAVLTAGAVSGGTASAAIPTALLTSTARAALQFALGQRAGIAGGASATTLANGVLKAMAWQKLKAVGAIILATTFLGSSTTVASYRAFGAALATLKPETKQSPNPQEAGSAPPDIEAQAASPVQKAPSAADPDPKIAGHFSGRVTGPDGKPLSGARVFIVPMYGADKEVGPVRATTSANGRFEFDAPDMTYAEVDGLPVRREDLILIATKDGYTPDWLRDHSGLYSRFQPVKGVALNLQLATDDVPIHGRFLDPAGRPLAGARVRLTRLMIPRGRDLDAHFDRLKKAGPYSMTDYERQLGRPDLVPGLTTETRTDAIGRFAFTGLGRDRLAELSVSAPSIVDTTVTVMTRDAPDVRIPDHEGKISPAAYGPGFTLQLKPGWTIKGRVIDRDSREPIPGMWVGGSQNIVNRFSSGLYPWVTDEQGRFTITGLDPIWGDPKQNFNRRIVAAAAPGLPYQTAWAEAKPKAEVLIECRRGIPFRLKLADDQGRPVEAEVTYLEVQPNADLVHDPVIWPVSWAARKAAGTYQGYVLPGPGAVLAKTPRGSGYRAARVDPKAFFAPGRTNWSSEEQITAYGTPDILTTPYSSGHYLDQRDYAAIVLVNPPPNSGPLQLSATVLRDRPRRVSLVDPGGKPVVGAKMFQQIQWPAYTIFPPRMWIVGVNTRETMLRAASFPLTGLHPERVQHITFIKEDRQLIGLLLARGDSDLPYIVRMQPWGTVTGRLVDEKGKPLADPGNILVDTGVSVKAEGADFCEVVDGRTDAQGRFRLERIIPGVSYKVEVYRSYKFAGIGFEKLVLRPGEVRDLGDIRAKPLVDAKPETKPGN